MITNENGEDMFGTVIKLDKSNKDTAKLFAVLLPEDAAQNVTWKSNKTGIAKVSSGGVVSPVAPGTAVITATAKDGSGRSASVTVKVVK